MDILHFSWRRILLTTTVDEKVSVRAIAKTFASGKTEKLVYQTLAELGLPSEKVRLYHSGILRISSKVLLTSWTPRCLPALHHRHPSSSPS